MERQGGGAETVSARFLAPLGAGAVEDGAVVMEAGRVAWAGPRAKLPSGSPPVRDLGDGILLPVPINAHCHLEFPRPPEPLARGDGFAAWARRVLAWEIPPSVRRETASRHAHDLARGGTGAVLDHAESGGPEVLVSAGLGGFSFREIRGIAPTFPDGDSRAPVAPHTPHTLLAADLFRAGSSLGPVSIHLAESEEEMGLYRGDRNDLAELLIERGFPQSHLDDLAASRSPVRRLERAGLLTPRLACVHCVHLEEDDLRRLAAKGCTIVLSPRSNEAIGVGRADLATMRRLGMRVCLGTDSLASAPDLEVRNDALALGGIDALEAWNILTLHPGRYLETNGLVGWGRIAKGSHAPVFYPTPGARTVEEAAQTALAAEAIRI